MFMTRSWSGAASSPSACGTVFTIRSKSGLRFVAFVFHLQLGDAVAGVGVDDGEVELGVIRVEVDEQVVDLVHDLGDPGVGPVDLVDHEDRRQPELQRLLQHEPGLRQRAFRGVHEQQHAVHHLEGALHFAAEVRVAGRVHDVDLHAVVVQGRVLGHDRDPALALEVDVVHDALLDAFVVAEGAALAEQRVHERGLAVVDVGDDGDVAEVCSFYHFFYPFFSVFRIPAKNALLDAETPCLRVSAVIHWVSTF